MGVVVGMMSGSLMVLLSDGGGHSGSGGNRFSFSNSLDVGLYPVVVPFELVLPRSFCRKARILPRASCIAYGSSVWLESWLYVDFLNDYYFWGIFGGSTPWWSGIHEALRFGSFALDLVTAGLALLFWPVQPVPCSQFSQTCSSSFLALFCTLSSLFAYMSLTVRPPVRSTH